MTAMHLRHIGVLAFTCLLAVAANAQRLEELPGPDGDTMHVRVPTASIKRYGRLVQYDRALTQFNLVQQRIVDRRTSHTDYAVDCERQTRAPLSELSTPPRPGDLRPVEGGDRYELRVVCAYAYAYAVIPRAGAAVDVTEAQMQQAWNGFDLALAAVKGGDRPKAIELLSAGLRVVPGETRLQMLLASLLELEDKQAEALERWKVAASTAADRQDRARADAAVKRLAGQGVGGGAPGPDGLGEAQAEAARIRDRQITKYLQESGVTAKAANGWCERESNDAFKLAARMKHEVVGLGGCDCDPDQEHPGLFRCAMNQSIDPLPEHKPR